MKYRKLGKYGIRVSEISLGAWLTFGGSVDDEMSKQCLTTAIDSGINFIDIADVYSSGNAETVVGKILADGNFSRKDLIISSKVFWPFSDGPNNVGLSRKHIMDSVDGSLKRLGMDYLDIYFCHRYDWLTPLRETVEAMDDLVRDGVVRYWGTSVWSAAQLERVVGICKEIGARLPTVEQPRYNLLDRYIELEVLNTAKHHGIGIVTWSPLAGGVLTGKYKDGIPAGTRAESTEFLKSSLTPENMAKISQLKQIADYKDITLAQLSLAWILRRDEITSVIAGATRVQHVESNVKASEVNLTSDELDKIEEIMENKPEFHPIYAPQMLTRE